jgi:hypothetical protein
MRPWLLTLAMAAACTPRVGIVGKVGAVPEARSAVLPGQADAVFARAVSALRARQYQFTECDDARSQLRTERTELDAGCFSSTCLARQVVTVKVGWRRVSLAVQREVWDAAGRSWIPATDAGSRADVEREERELVEELLHADLGEIARERLGSAHDPACPAVEVHDETPGPQGSGEAVSVLGGPT